MDEEVQRALYGVKQMKEVLWRNGQKHEHLMNSLKHSSEKKQVRPTGTKERDEMSRSQKAGGKKVVFLLLSATRRQHSWLRR